MMPDKNTDKNKEKNEERDKERNKKGSKPWFVYLITLIMLLLSITIIISMAAGIKNDVSQSRELNLKADYSSITAKALIILSFIFLIVVSIFLFLLKPITIKLLYIAVVLIAAILLFAQMAFIVPVELIAGGALIEFLKRVKHEGERMFN